MKNNHITKEQEETIIVAKEFAKNLKGGEIIGLSGELGSGKTVFAKGLAKALGVKEIINSPTFVLMKNYNADYDSIKRFIHIDAYRLGNNTKLENIGLEEYLGTKDTVIVIEWFNYIKKSLPGKLIQIELKHINESTREINIL